MSGTDTTPAGGPPPVPIGPGPYTFRCVLTAVGPSEVEELAEIFHDHGRTVLADGASDFTLKISDDKKYLQIEETYDGPSADEIFSRRHSKDGTRYWHERVSRLQCGINATFWRPA